MADHDGRVGWVVSLLVGVTIMGLVSGQDKVSLYLEVEAQCPDCQMFVRFQMEPVFEAEGVWDILDLTFVPWGNAYCETSSCPGSGSYVSSVYKCWISECDVASPPSDCFTCISTQGIGEVNQHGKDEGEGNRIEACAMNIYQNSTIWWPFVYCFEGLHEGDLNYAQSCAESASLDYSALSDCVFSNSGVSYTQYNAKMSLDMGPHSGVPYALLNGQAFTGGSLLKAICDAYTGIPPSGCN